MIDYSAINIEKLIIHQVGNKVKEIKNVVSNNICEFDDDLFTLLSNYFLTPFSKQIELYKFSHHSSIDLNELFTYSKELFDNSANFKDISIKILNHLYEQSEHQNIKTGELLIAYVSDLIYEDELTDGIVIFKVERKSKFFKFSESKTKISISADKGASAKKTDKGCLIINTERKDGFRVFSIDNNNYDAEYWKQKFLKLDFVKDINYQTSHYVDFCKSFSENFVQPNKGKDEQIAFLNKSINYLSQKENFDMNEFVDEVFDEEEMVADFFKHKQNYEDEREYDIQEQFPISQKTVKVKKRNIKSLIKLDTNIQIKLDDDDPEYTKNYIEKGFDKDKQMYFYKVFYNFEDN